MLGPQASLLFVAMLAARACGTLLFTDYGVGLPLYRWSRGGSLPNGTFTLTANATGPPPGPASCALIPDQVDWIPARAALERLPPGTACAVVQANGLLSTYNKWIEPASVLDTPFAVGVVFVPSSFFFVPAGGAPVRFLGWDPNYYLEAFGYRVAFYAVLLVLNVACAAWGLRNLALRRQEDGLVLNTAMVCIGLETLSALLRVIEVAITLVYLTEPWLALNRSLDTLLVYVGSSCSVTSGIFVVFFWIDMTSGSLYQGAFLHKAFKPCVAFAAAFVTVNVVCAVLATAAAYLYAILYVQIAMLALVGTLSLVYFGAAFRVVRYVRAREDCGPDTKAALMAISYKIVASGALILVMILCSLVWLWASGSVGALAGEFVLNLVFVARAALEISIFGTPRPRPKASVSTSEGTGTAENSEL
jgi:hypothetical protein